MRLRTSTVCLVLALLGCDKREPKSDEPKSDEPKPDEPKPVVSSAGDQEVGSAPAPDPAQKRLPKIASGTQIPEGFVVHASMRELSIDDQMLAVMQDGVPAAGAVSGHLIVPLAEQLEQEAGKARLVAEANGEEWSGRMILDFDARVPFSTVVDTMYTGGRTGFTNYAFVVESDHPGQRALLVAPPQFGVPKSPRLKVFISNTGLRVALPGETEPRELPKRDAAGSGSDAWDQPGLAAIVDEVRKADPELRAAVVSAENDIELGVLLGTYATLAGPSCDQAKPQTCLLPELIIEAGAG